MGIEKDSELYDKKDEIRLEKPEVSVEETPQNTNSNKKVDVWVYVIIISLLAFAGAVVGKHILSSKVEVVAKPEPRPVKTMRIKPVKDILELQYPGSTRAIQQVDVGFNVSGQIIDLPIKAGDTIKKGQVLGRIDPRDFQNELNAKMANLKNASATLERTKKLYKEAIVAKSVLDGDLAAYKQAEADMKIAEKAREDCTLKAPFAGVAAIRYVDNYQTVAAGKPIISLQDLTNLEIQIDVPEWIVSQVRKNQGAEIVAVYDTMPNDRIPLKIKEFSAEANQTTRTYKVRFYMTRAPKSKSTVILPGMTVNVIMNITPEKNGKESFMLPVWAVNSNAADNSPGVFVVDESKTPWVVNRRKVTAGPLTADSIIVSGDLKTGERVVIAGAERLMPGLEVKDLPVFLQTGYGSKSSNEAMGMDQTPPKDSAVTESAVEVEGKK